MALAFCAVLFWAPILQAKGLDFDRLQLVFDEDFKNLSVSAHGPGTRWTAHTPWAGDFGDAQFIDPQPGFPFHLADDGFRIEMRKTAEGRWQSGLLSSTDPAGAGFTLRYGYFEMRAKLPAGPGVWPAFWLNSRPPPNSMDPSIEIDVIEQYGQFPGAFNSTVTVWPREKGVKPRSEMKINTVPTGTMSREFHTYGVSIDPEWIVFFFDRVEVWRTHTPPDKNYGFMILLDLGLGSGWPIDKTPNPSYMFIDYVRAYAPKP
jgi:hypothetical protein